MEILIIFAGGMLGGMFRFVLSKVPHREGIPVGTIVANTIACFLLGMVTQAELTGWWLLFLSVGVAGALSTWSTLAKELGDMLTARKYARCAAYLALTLFFGVVAAGLGAPFPRYA